MYKLYPWLILITAAIGVIFLGGKRRAFGLFVAQLHTEFNDTSLAELNWIGDSYAALGHLSTSLTTAFIIKMRHQFKMAQFLGALFILFSCVTSSYVPNPHWLFLTHTVLHGLGSSLVLSTSGLMVTEYFDQSHPYHLLAATLVSGGSVASLVFVEFYAFLIDIHGWRMALTILGIVYFIILNFGTCVFRQNPDKRIDSKQITTNTAQRLKSVWHRLLLLFWLIDRVLTSIVTYGILLNLADYMHRKNVSMRSSALLTIYFAAGEASAYVCGAVLTALTRDLFNNRIKYILIVTSFIMGICLILWEMCSHLPLLNSIFAYIAGFCLGPSITFLFAAGEEMTMLPGKLAYPFSLGAMGFGMLISPILSAVIAQSFQYHWFFLVQGLLMLIKCSSLISSTLLLRKVSNICLDTRPSYSRLQEDIERNFQPINEVSFDQDDNKTMIIYSEDESKQPLI